MGTVGLLDRVGVFEPCSEVLGRLLVGHHPGGEYRRVAISGHADFFLTSILGFGRQTGQGRQPRLGIARQDVDHRQSGPDGGCQTVVIGLADRSDQVRGGRSCRIDQDGIHLIDQPIERKRLSGLIPIWPGWDTFQF